MPTAIEIKQYEGGSRAELKHPRKRPTRGLIAFCFLVLPGLVFGECPWAPGAPRVGWVELLTNDLAARFDSAFTPLLVCLLGVLWIVAIFDNGRDGIQPGHNQPQRPEPGTPTGGNQPHRKGIV